MRKTFVILNSVCFVLFMSSCASAAVAKIKSETKNPQFQGGAGKKTLVVMATADQAMREDIENQFAIEGANRQLALTPCHRLVADFKGLTREGLEELVRTESFDRVLVIRSVPGKAKGGTHTVYADHYSPMLVSGLYDGWGSMTSVIWSPSAPPASLGRYVKLTIETSLFDAADASNIWTSLAEVTTSERPGEAAESYVRAVLTRLERAGLL